MKARNLVGMTTALAITIAGVYLGRKAVEHITTGNETLDIIIGSLLIPILGVVIAVMVSDRIYNHKNKK